MILSAQACEAHANSTKTEPTNLRMFSPQTGIRSKTINLRFPSKGPSGANEEHLMTVAAPETETDRLIQSEENRLRAIRMQMETQTGTDLNRLSALLDMEKEAMANLKRLRGEAR
jgi:hypothetical protein